MKRELAILAVLIVCTVSQVAADDAVDGRGLLPICSNAVRMLDGESVEQEQRGDLPYCLAFVTAVRQAAEGEAARGQSLEDEGVQCRWHYDTGWVSEVGSVARKLFRPVCHPKSLTAEQIARITVDFMIRHPEELHASGAALVAAAIRQSFPCGPD